MKLQKKIHILIINNAEKSINDFTRPLEKIVARAGCSFETMQYSDTPERESHSADGLLLSGSPQGDDIVEHHLPFYHWLKEIKKPALGICAGHHITGYLFGSTLFRGEEPESGDLIIEVTKDDMLFSGLPQTINVKQMHNDSISIPPGFELLATSKTCHNQLMKHRNKPIYSCQFHPEFYNHQLIHNFLKIIVKESLLADKF